MKHIQIFNNNKDNFIDFVMIISLNLILWTNRGLNLTTVNYSFYNFLFLKKY